MEDFLQELRRLASGTYTRLYTFLKEVNPVALQLTGLLGIAAVVVGVYQFRTCRRRNSRNQHNRAQREPSSQGARGASTKPATALGRVAAESAPIPLNDLRSHMPGIKTITLSAPGVLLEEWDPEKLEEGVTVKPDAIEIVREMASGMHVYIIAHVESDVAEAAVRTALDSVNLLGSSIRQLPPHRLVFCGKLKGKVSLVRQIEPQLHIDGTSETLEELQRFIPHLYQVVKKGTAPAVCKSSLIACGPTLPDALNVQVFD